MSPAAQSVSLPVCINLEQWINIFLRREAFIQVWQPKLMSAITADINFSVSLFTCWIHICHASHNMKNITQSSSASAVCLSAFLIFPWAHISDCGSSRPALMLDERSPCGESFPFRTVCCEYLIPLSQSLLPYRMLSHLPPQPFVLWFGFTGTARMEPSSTYDILW